MTPENRRPQAPVTKELHPGIVPVDEGGERPHLDDAPSVQDINTGEIPTLLPDHSGKLILTDEERNSDDFQRLTDAQREYHEQRTSTEPNKSHRRRNIAIGTTSLLLVGGATAGIIAANSESSDTPVETKPSATSAPTAGETQTPVATAPVESALASPTNLGPLETPKPTATTETQKPTVEVMPVSLEKYKAMTAEQFAALPKSEQLTYWSWQSHNMDAFAKELHAATLDPRDKLVAASETNTAQEIETIQGYNIRLIFSIEDELEREKALTSVLYNGKGSRAHAYWMGHLKQIPSDILNLELLAQNVVAPSDYVATGPRGVKNGVTYQDMKSPDGSHTVRHYYMPYADAQTGAQAHTWIRD